MSAEIAMSPASPFTKPARAETKAHRWTGPCRGIAGSANAVRAAGHQHVDRTLESDRIDWPAPQTWPMRYHSIQPRVCEGLPSSSSLRALRVDFASFAVKGCLFPAKSKQEGLIRAPSRSILPALLAGFYFRGADSCCLGRAPSGPVGFAVRSLDSGSNGICSSAAGLCARRRRE